MQDQIQVTGFASLVFGALSQSVGGLTIRRVADDAATVTLANGQAFTVTVTASRPKVAYTKPVVVKREKDGKP